VWSPAPELANRIIGEKIDWEVLPGKTNNNIRVLENGKWWFVDFCKFQYGNIRRVSDSKVQNHLCSLLDEHGLWDLYLATVGQEKAYSKPTVQEKEKEKDKEKEREKEEEKEADKKQSYAESVTLKPSEHEKLVAQYGEVNTRRAISKLSAYKLEKGKHYKSDYGAILNWVMREVVGGKGGAVPEPIKIAADRPDCPNCHTRLAPPDQGTMACLNCKKIYRLENRELLDVTREVLGREA
jgi:DNA-directed RNA polymerase subunit M/transcription elongation factor TFIIS